MILTTRTQKTRFFELYVGKLLKKISSFHISLNAKQQINSFLCIICQKISQKAFDIVNILEKKTISKNEIFSSLNFLIPSLAEELKNNVHEILSDDKKEVKTTYHLSRQNKVGIIFAPSVCERFLRNFGNWKIKLTSDSPIVLAIIIEEICKRVLLPSIEVCKENGKNRISLRHVELGSRRDKNIQELMRNCNCRFLGGGVPPYIHDSLLATRRPKKRKKNILPIPIDERKRKFRPGTVCLREIRRIQKTGNCLIFAKIPFQRLVRSSVETFSEDLKIGKKVFIVLQYYIEQYLTELLETSNNIAVYSNRVKVLAADIRFVCKLRNIEIEEDKEDLKDSKENTEDNAEEESI